MCTPYACRKAQQNYLLLNERHFSNTKSSVLNQQPCPKETVLDIWLEGLRERAETAFLPHAIHSAITTLWEVGLAGTLLTVFLGESLGNYGTGR